MNTVIVHKERQNTYEGGEESLIRTTSVNFL